MHRYTVFMLFGSAVLAADGSRLWAVFIIVSTQHNADHTTQCICIVQLEVIRKSTTTLHDASFHSINHFTTAFSWLGHVRCHAWVWVVDIQWFHYPQSSSFLDVLFQGCMRLSMRTSVLPLLLLRVAAVGPALDPCSAECLRSTWCSFTTSDTFLFMLVNGYCF